MIRRFWHAILDVLLDELSTRDLERFLAGTTIFCGLWVLSPLWRSFGPFTALRNIPEWATGSVLLMHGLTHWWALKRPQIGLCRRAALTTSGIYAGITLTFLLEPPRTLFVVPMTASVATAAFLVFIRLRLLYHEP